MLQTLEVHGAQAGMVMGVKFIPSKPYKLHLCIDRNKSHTHTNIYITH